VGGLQPPSPDAGAEYAGTDEAGALLAREIVSLPYPVGGFQPPPDAGAASRAASRALPLVGAGAEYAGAEDAGAPRFFGSYPAAGAVQAIIFVPPVWGLCPALNRRKLAWPPRAAWGAKASAVPMTTAYAVAAYTRLLILG